MEKIICDKALSGIGLTDDEHSICKQIRDTIKNMKLLGLPSWTNEDKIFYWTPIIIKKDELGIDNKEFNFIDLDVNQNTQLNFLKILDKWNVIKSMIEEKFSFKFDDYYNMDLTLANKDGSKFRVEYNPLTLENIFKIKSLRYDGFIHFEGDEREIDEEDKYRRGEIIKELKEMITKNKDNKYNINDEKIVIDKIKEGWSDVEALNHELTSSEDAWMYCYAEEITKEKSEEIRNKLNEYILTQLLNRHLFPYFFNKFTKSFIVDIHRTHSWDPYHQIFILGIMENKDLAGMTMYIH